MTEFLLYESDHCTVEQAYGFRVPGYLVVQPKTECARLADLPGDVSIDLMRCLVIAESIVNAHVDAERIYVLKFGEESPRVHFHVVPRTAAILRGYLRDSDDETPYSGAAIVDWIWHNHLSLGFDEDDLAAFVARAIHSSARQPIPGPEPFS